ncbi:hypothetical protein [Paraburkholderia caledonica]|uniref:hypothetical protein n=1 Tax=Paraburkholderia caledonica TaxID=134536 RepID=UPI0038BB14C0
MTEQEMQEARKRALQAAREAKRAQEKGAREKRNAAVTITVKPRRKAAVPEQPLPAPATTARARKKQRKREEDAARLAAALKIPKKSRVIRTYTDAQAKARWKGQPTQVVITPAYPGYTSPAPREVDLLDLAWQGGAPGSGKRK